MRAPSNSYGDDPQFAGMKPTPPPLVLDLASPRPSTTDTDTPQPADIAREIGTMLAIHLGIAAAVALTLAALVPTWL